MGKPTFQVLNPGFAPATAPPIYTLGDVKNHHVGESLHLLLAGFVPSETIFGRKLETLPSPPWLISTTTL